MKTKDDFIIRKISFEIERNSPKTKWKQLSIWIKKFGDPFYQYRNKYDETITYMFKK